MRYLNVIVLISFGTLCYSQDNTQNMLFPPDELRQDINFLFDNLEVIHPDLYFHTSKIAIDKMRQDVNDAIDKPMSRMEFALKIIPIVTALQDGHTRLLLPTEERTKYLNNGGTIFPFFIGSKENGVYITQNLSSDSSILINSKILSINGFLIDEIIATMYKYKSAELDQYRNILVERDFGRLLWYLFGFESNYELNLEYDKKRYNKTVAGISLDDYRGIIKKQRTKNTVIPYHYYQLDDPSIGVIDFQRMSHKKDFKEFLDSTFLEIKKNNIRHLIIDIRKNGGGNSQLAKLLFSYITDKPYKMAEQMDIKVSKQTKKKIKNRNIKWHLYPFAYPMSIFFAQARPYFYGRSGQTKTIHETKLTYPKNRDLKFNGQSYLLISPYTFSSANMLAITYKCYQMGTVIGEETGGVYTAFGDVIDFQLPNTNLTAHCSHKKFIHPCNPGEVHGVIPDIKIKSSMEDLALGKDPIIEGVRSIAKKEYSKTD